jgi:hypothetical protein
MEVNVQTPKLCFDIILNCYLFKKKIVNKENEFN